MSPNPGHQDLTVTIDVTELFGQVKALEAIVDAQKERLESLEDRHQRLSDDVKALTESVSKVVAELSGLKGKLAVAALVASAVGGLIPTLIGFMLRG